MERREHNREYWAGLRRRLEGQTGRRYWQSLDELADTDEFRRNLEVEFPAIAPLLNETSRRDVLRVMGASLALAGLGACDPIPPEEPAIPYVQAPEFMVPGEPRYYATAARLGGYALPLLVETHMARPIKAEGNPEHPVSRGATDIFGQASVLDLYDPDRSNAVTYYDSISTWDACQLELVERAAALAERGGEGLALLTSTITSPTAGRQLSALRERFPQMRLYVHEPVGNERQHEAARLAFGEELDVHFRLDRADAILSLEADLLGPGPTQVWYAGQWIERRREALAEGRLPELVVLESTPTLTGSKATARVPASTAELTNFTLALAQELGIGGAVAPDLPLALRARLLSVVEQLRGAGGRALVAPGPHLPPDVQALAFAINDRLGALGQTIAVSEPIEATRQADGGLAELALEIDAGAIETLLILDANPVYTAPADVPFGDLLQRVPFRLHLGPFRDETAVLCHWHVPLAHPFESWSDARAVNGMASVIQPLLRPWFGGRTVHEVLATLAGEPQLSARELVQATWAGRLNGDERAWRELLHLGFAPETGVDFRTAAVRDVQPPEPEPLGGQLDAAVRPDPSIWDGRFANNAWLQELPKPFTKLTWDNAVAISPALAEERGLRQGDLVDISGGERRLRGPVWVLPGQAERTITVYLGYGRLRTGRVGDALGYDAYRLRTTAEPWSVRNVVMQATGFEANLASTQDHGSLHDREHIIREITVEELQQGQRVAEDPGPRPSLYPEWAYPDYAWAMVIDLEACIGCNACVVACVAENNIPMVGKEQVAMGREMHWLKIDRYYTGPPERPETHWQPRPCMHCEKAPCEVGCPVNATVHGPEGLNQMIYNRCVGTRTCASYCPYKVRRFNYYDYTDLEPDSLIARRNPDVTVRARGVMEKCTYCVQRINAARIEAKMEGRRIRDGEVQTACQQACPTRAIIFGDQNDPDSVVARAKESPRNYALLGELSTQPRTTYLAGVRAAHDGSRAERS